MAAAYGEWSSREAVRYVRASNATAQGSAAQVLHSIWALGLTTPMHAFGLPPARRHDPTCGTSASAWSCIWHGP